MFYQVLAYQSKYKLNNFVSSFGEFCAIHCSQLLTTLSTKFLSFAVRILLVNTLKTSDFCRNVWYFSKNQCLKPKHFCILLLILPWKPQQFQWNILLLMWEWKKIQHLFLPLGFIQTNKERRMQHIYISKFYLFNYFNLSVIKCSFGKEKGKVSCFHFSLMVKKLLVLWEE